MLMRCTNTFWVSESDKKSHFDQGPLERSNLKCLLNDDPKLRSFVQNEINVAVFLGSIEHSFGLIHRSPGQIIRLHEQITNFQNKKLIWQHDNPKL
jgi:hypothetical protein